MKRKHIIIFILSGLFFTTGCKKYLQVQPAGSYTETQLFANESAAQQALNGLYINMADKALYGETLTQSYIEIMAQRFKTAFTGSLYYESFQNYQYDVQQVRTVFDNTWKKAYGTILAANVFVNNIDNSIASHVMSEAHGKQMKGEALAVRAMVHLDMMRLFAPVFSVGADQPAIPYYTGVDGRSQPILTSTQVLQKVLDDLTQAETLLANDPVKTIGVAAQNDFYAGYRNQRINYYAVKALKARAYMWGGSKTLAHDAALAALNEGEKWFPWMDFTAIVGNPDPDRVFSPELIFALYNPSLYTNYNSYYSPAVLDNYILTADATNLRNTYEANENDYRYTTTWLITTKTYRTFFKYAPPTVTYVSRSWQFLQPMIRKTELYYILAETESDPAMALGYLNAVRNKRGLPDLATGVNIPNEVTKEFKKEFYGEGQLFFHYKRINSSSVQHAQYNYPLMPTYIVPLPLSETTPR